MLQRLPLGRAKGCVGRGGVHGRALYTARGALGSVAAWRRVARAIGRAPQLGYATRQNPNLVALGAGRESNAVPAPVLVRRGTQRALRCPWNREALPHLHPREDNEI